MPRIFDDCFRQLPFTVISAYSCPHPGTLCPQHCLAQSRSSKHFPLWHDYILLKEATVSCHAEFRALRLCHFTPWLCAGPQCAFSRCLPWEFRRLGTWTLSVSPAMCIPLAGSVLSFCVLSCFSHVQLFATPWTVARQAPLSMGILQTRMLEWVPMPSSRRSSPSRDLTHVSCSFCIAGGFFTTEPLGKPGPPQMLVNELRLLPQKPNCSGLCVIYKINS